MLARRLKNRKSTFEPLPEPALSMLTRDARLQSGYERDYEKALWHAALGNPERLLNLLQAGRALKITERIALSQLLERYSPRPRGRPKPSAALETTAPKLSLHAALLEALGKRPAALLGLVRSTKLYEPESANVLVQYLRQVLPHQRGSPKKPPLHKAAILAHSLLEPLRAQNGRLDRKVVQAVIEYARVNTERWTGVSIDSRALQSLMREPKSRIG